jgi:hypothetical protein
MIKYVHISSVLKVTYFIFLVTNIPLQIHVPNKTSAIYTNNRMVEGGKGRVRNQCGKSDAGPLLLFLSSNAKLRSLSFCSEQA